MDTDETKSVADTEPVQVTLTPIRKHSSGRVDQLPRFPDASALRRSLSNGPSPTPLLKTKSGVLTFLSNLGEAPVQFVEPSVWANLYLIPDCVRATDALGSFVTVRLPSLTGKPGREVKIYSL